MTHTPPIRFYYCPACCLPFTCHQPPGVDPIASRMVNCAHCSIPVSTESVVSVIARRYGALMGVAR